MKTTYYYKSPIGILKLVCSKDALVYMDFVNDCENNPKELTHIMLTCKEQLDKYFTGELKEFAIPLAFEIGTEFQQSVWKALSKIPFGETRSYKDIAKYIGNPKAVRAVGGANNKNPISIVIPCHRVIGSSGKLVGYASGLENKEWLLTHEKKIGQKMIKPNHMDKEKIYKTKDIIPALKYYGNSFDKIKTNHPDRAKALILGFKVYKSGLNEEQLSLHVKKKITDREITDLLGYKELKSIRSWSISSSLKQEDKELELLRIWCMKLGAIALLAELSQKDIIEIAKNTEELDCSVPIEF